MFDLPVISHCEDKKLSAEGVMNEGFVSTVLGLPGIPGAAEEAGVARDVMLAELAQSRIHIAHVSTAGSVEIVRRAKAKGVKVTAETAPHYFTLTEEEVRTFDTNMKVNPPLRTSADVEAIKQGLKDGTIDIVASDHAPHSIAEKEREFGLAPSGIIGLETSLALVLRELVDGGVLSLTEAISKMTVNPGNILGLGKGTLTEGAEADITIVNPDMEYTVEEFASKSKNSPFIGKNFKGLVETVIFEGKIILEK